MANLQHLSELIRVLENVDETKFRMTTWFWKRECGTYACAAGWAAQDNYFSQRGLKLITYRHAFYGGGTSREHFKIIEYQNSEGRFTSYGALSKFFDISVQEADFLFGVDHYHRADWRDNIPLSAVLERVRAFYKDKHQEQKAAQTVSRREAVLEHA